MLRTLYQRPGFISQDSNAPDRAWIFMGSPGYGAHKHLDNDEGWTWQAQVSVVVLVIILILIMTINYLIIIIFSLSTLINNHYHQLKGIKSWSLSPPPECSWQCQDNLEVRPDILLEQVCDRLMVIFCFIRR